MLASEESIRSGGCSWRLCTPRLPGAVAIFQLTGDIEWALSRLGIATCNVGQVVVRSLGGVDSGLVARWTTASAQLMPHGGTAVTRALAAKLVSVGICESIALPCPCGLYFEAADDIERQMLATLASAASPLAVDRLLAEPDRWRRHVQTGHGVCDASVSAALRYLIMPPLVVAVGPANIGKSTLINTLAGRSVSIVADEPGTTRDHVGVMLNMAGLVVRYVDTPGLRSTEDHIESQAQSLAWGVAHAADLLILLGDAGSPPIDSAALPGVRTLRVALREDISAADWRADVRVSSHTGTGLAHLTETVRERLVPQCVLHDPRPWPFWELETEVAQNHLRP